MQALTAKIDHLCQVMHMHLMFHMFYPYASPVNASKQFQATQENETHRGYVNQNDHCQYQKQASAYTAVQVAVSMGTQTPNASIPNTVCTISGLSMLVRWPTATGTSSGPSVNRKFASYAPEATGIKHDLELKCRSQLRIQWD